VQGLSSYTLHTDISGHSGSCWLQYMTEEVSRATYLPVCTLERHGPFLYSVFERITVKETDRLESCLNKMTGIVLDTV